MKGNTKALTIQTIVNLVLLKRNKGVHWAVQSESLTMKGV